MALWVFDGNMVGKWTNEPCNGEDEAVNHFWVLTVRDLPESSLYEDSPLPFIGYW